MGAPGVLLQLLRVLCDTTPDAASDAIATLFSEAATRLNGESMQPHELKVLSRICQRRIPCGGGDGEMTVDELRTVCCKLGWEGIPPGTWVSSKDSSHQSDAPTKDGSSDVVGSSDEDCSTVSDYGSSSGMWTYS